MAKNLLLISNTSVPGGKKLNHAKEEIKALLGKKVDVVRFIPYANPGGMGYAEYTALLQPVFKEMDIILCKLMKKDHLISILKLPKQSLLEEATPGNFLKN